jgi:protein-L-isoaspartate(D-aspartate) O-methyltransferase
MIPLEAQRRRLHLRLKRRGINDPAVLAAFLDVRREAFLPANMADVAYQDTALPIDEGQTISQPYVVALMAEGLLLSADDRVLEIGAGSGYAAAILARISREVYTVERHAQLATQAARNLREEGFDNVIVAHGDGTLGWPEHAPYDAIVVAAGGPDVPQPLLDQLAIGGRLVMPVGEESHQQLIRVIRTGAADFRREDLGEVRFVPLIGAQGWTSTEGPTERRD